MVVETHMKLDVTARFSRKKCFALKIWKIDQKWTKNMVFGIY